MTQPIYFTADEHYGHRNIIKYCNRPFDDVNHMTEILIANFNAKVPPHGLTYHLGDIFWDSVSIADARNILKRLNGRHILVWGNHDGTSEKIKYYTSEGHFERTADVLLIRQDGAPKIFMSHYAHRVWPDSHKGSYHLFGHSHNQLPAYGLSLDVGVDGNNFTPYSISEINKIMLKKIAQGYKDPLADQVEKNPWDKSDRPKGD
jgi:calcineurin-like phosphoesterase family protein